jgi:four helix bundle protein
MRNAECGSEIVDCGLRIADWRGKAVTPEELRARTREFASAIVRLVEAMPRSRAADVIGNQLMRSGTSVAANYRAACRARSHREFIAKMGIVEEEADEAEFWLELASEQSLGDPRDLELLRKEAGQLVAIVVTSIRTARRANPQSAIRNPQSSNPHSALRIPH